jgi:hypothetical protein
VNRELHLALGSVGGEVRRYAPSSPAQRFSHLYTDVRANIWRLVLTPGTVPLETEFTLTHGNTQ